MCSGCGVFPLSFFLSSHLSFYRNRRNTLNNIVFVYSAFPPSLPLCIICLGVYLRSRMGVIILNIFEINCSQLIQYEILKKLVTFIVIYIEICNLAENCLFYTKNIFFCNTWIRPISFFSLILSTNVLYVP